MKTTFSYPKWAEIPNIDPIWTRFYSMSIRSVPPISPDKDKGPTASMVNHYVKHGYLTKPDKKKIPTPTNCPFDCYYNPQVCISIQEIAQTLNTLQNQASSEQLYDAFVDYMNQGIGPSKPYHPNQLSNC